MTQINEVQLPAILSIVATEPQAAFPVDLAERAFLQQARQLFDAGFYGHSLLDIWNAAVSNLRRRVEAYSVEMFVSSVKDEAGRKKYAKDEETLSERWSGVDDLVLIVGAERLGLLNKKAGKALEMINWMRNHATPAHASPNQVEAPEVAALAIMLQTSLFSQPLPDPGHSVAGLFGPIRTSKLDADNILLLRDQILALRVQDLRVCFGFLLDNVCKGVEPAYANSLDLFQYAWDRADDDLRRIVGLRYHSYTVSPDADDSADKGARLRVLELLVKVHGVQFIPDAARAQLFRLAAQQLATAKNTHYGWGSEVMAAQTLSQFGPCVPSIAFEEVYQEILAVWCGNMWGRSAASEVLTPFMEVLQTQHLRSIASMFQQNPRTRSELFYPRPKARALELLGWVRDRLTLASHKAEVDLAIASVNAL